ncbi:MAG: adenosylcobinamide-GDP ribazoletransferase [Acetobacter syzygii]
MTNTPPDSLFGQLRLDLACGLSLLTRLPAGWLAPPASRTSTLPWPLARSLWCWPLIALGIGALTGSVLAMLRLAHLPALAAAGLALVCQSALTGGLHEDGLADMADGCGGNTVERRLAIMRDSRIGSYGVIALCLSLLVRASALATLPVWACLTVCSITACLARLAMLLVPTLALPARTDGLARTLTPLPTRALCVATFLAVSATFGLSFIVSGKGEALFSCLALGLGATALACATAGVVAVCAKRLLSGYTGDVLGCCAVLAECLLLNLYAAAL